MRSFPGRARKKQRLLNLIRYIKSAIISLSLNQLVKFLKGTSKTPYITFSFGERIGVRQEKYF